MPTLEELQRVMRDRLADVGIAVEAGVPTRRDPDRAPLSFSQRLVCAHQQRVPDSTANNICLTFTYTGEVDQVALHRALLAVVRRHEILRTTYHFDDDGEPYQRIHTEFEPPVGTLDLRAAPDPEARLRSHVADVATEVFDLATESSVRLTFVNLPPDEANTTRLAVVIAMQHIVWDGMTLPAMARDTARFYDAARAHPHQVLEVAPLSPQVADFADWEQDRFARTDHGDDRRFWEKQLSGGIEMSSLPYDRHPEQVSERSARVDRTLSTPAETSLRSLSTDLLVPPFSVFLATYYLALRRLTGRREVLIGSTVANREESGMEALIGNFSNSIVLRIGGDGEDFAYLVKHVRAVTDAAFEHRTFPFEHIVDIARRVTGDQSAQPFDSLVLFLDQKIDGIHLPDATMTWELADKGRVALPLTVEAFMHPDRTEVQISYQVDLFDESTVSRLHDHIDEILSTVTARQRYADLLSSEATGE